jgi:hypothetical protein
MARQQKTKPTSLLRLKSSLQSAGAGVRESIRWLADAGTSPFAIACVLYLCAAGCSVAGVFFLVGHGWALLSAAPFFLMAALSILRGMGRVSAE